VRLQWGWNGEGDNGGGCDGAMAVEAIVVVWWQGWWWWYGDGG